MPTKKRADQSPSRGILNVLRALGKTFVAASAVFYVVGFIVANFNLLRYGIYEFSLIKSKYIAAGILYFTIITIGSLPAWTLGISMNPPNAVAVRKFLQGVINDLDPQMSFEEMKERVLSEAAAYRMHGMSLRLWNVYVDSKELKEWEPALDIPPKAAMVEFLLRKVGPRYRKHMIGSVIFGILFLMAPGIYFLNKAITGMPFMGGNTWWQAARISFPVWILFVLLVIIRLSRPLIITTT